MSQRNLRLLLIVLGVMLILCSLTALVFAWWPLASVMDQVPLEPTLFVPP